MLFLSDTTKSRVFSYYSPPFDLHEYCTMQPTIDNICLLAMISYNQDIFQDITSYNKNNLVIT